MDLRKTSAAFLAVMLLGATSTAGLAQNNNAGSGNQGASQSDTTGATTSGNSENATSNSLNDADDKGNQVRCDNNPGGEGKAGTVTTADPGACPQ